VKSFTLVESTLDGFNRTERAVNNAVRRKEYRKIKAESSRKKKEGRKQTKPKYYLSKRSFSPPFENSKFNLVPLLEHEGELTSHPLFKPLAHFLRLLYQKNLFEKEPAAKKIEYRLLEAIVKKARKSPQVSTLADLYPDDPKLSWIYYKMLKGTNQYNREEGIPPLGDFIVLHKGAPAISLMFASPLLLEALLGAEISTWIMLEEKRKWQESSKYYFISKDDLQPILSKDFSLASSFLALEPFMDYSKKLTRIQQISGRDKETGIGIEKSLSSR
jgi:hypothetical protein